MICPHCKQEFIPKRKNQIYCSEKCRKLAYKKRKYAREHKKVKTCPVCRGLFLGFKKNKYCSKSCKRKALRKKYIEKHGEEHYKQFLKKWRETHKDKIKEYKQKLNKDPKIKEKKRIEFYKINDATREKSEKEGKYGTEWTDKEIQFLLDNWNKMTKKEIAEALGRSYAAVYAKL